MVLPTVEAVVEMMNSNRVVSIMMRLKLINLTMMAGTMLKQFFFKYVIDQK